MSKLPLPEVRVSARVEPKIKKALFRWWKKEGWNESIAIRKALETAIPAEFFENRGGSRPVKRLVVRRPRKPSL